MRYLIWILAAFLLAGCEEAVPPIYEEPFPLTLAAGDDSLGPRITVGPMERFD